MTVIEKGKDMQSDQKGRSASAGRQQHGGRFKPGQSGNPQGRKAGSRNRASVMLDQLFAEDGQEIAAAVISAAKAGDMVAARLILERICPVRRGRPVTVELPPIGTAEDAVVAVGRVVEAMAKGDLTPDEAASFVAVLDGHRKAVESVDILRRIEALEADRDIRS